VAQIAKESIGVTGGATSELPDPNENDAKENSPKKFLSKRKSSKGDAIPASISKLNVSSDGSINNPEDMKSSEPKVDEPPLPPEPPKVEAVEKTPVQSTFGWRGWWSRPDGYSEVDKPKAAEETTEAQKVPLPDATPSEEPQGMKEGLDTVKSPEPVKEQTASPEDASQLKADSGTANASATQSRSWFGLWSNAQNAQSNPTPAEPLGIPPKQDVIEPEPAPEPPVVEPQVTKSAEASKGPEMEDAPKDPKPPPKSNWAFFWSRETPESEGKPDEDSAQKQVGEIAVADTPSQSRPEAAQFNSQETVLQKPPKTKAKSLRGRTKLEESSAESSKAATPSKTTPSQSPSRVDTAVAPLPAPKQAVKAKQEPSNLILPEFRNTYHLVQKPSYWQQIRQYFQGGEPAMPHLHINPAPPRIKKAIAIGVHGYFPAPIIQKVLGQPTGTSIRFANAAAAAIQEWTEARGYSPEIEKVALEGEGFVSDRVNTLWKLLLNWVEHIRSADFILVACHSQGVPVAIMLVAKLIQFGCVNAARIGVCAMAGVNLGPFAEFKTRYLGATAAELFQFSDPKSLVSQMYLQALEETLRYGVRILYVGSIDDQLVSLESSTFSNISHPYIYRAVFVDGRIHAPDFITHLVGFALKLRNLGLPDHGLIRELSPALAGSLYGGEGHSRIYEDARIYSLAVSHALETTSLPISPVQQRPTTSGLGLPGLKVPSIEAKTKHDPYSLKVESYEGLGSGNQNPYFLPWAMRGLLEEEFVKKELGREVEDLLSLFEDWKPNGKLLRDVRYRLEGVKSKL
jgi:hypothetical protein